MRSVFLGVSLLALMAPVAFAQQSTTGTFEGQPAPGHYQVYFGFDQSTVTPEAQGVIAAAAEEYRRTGSAQLSISGYADRAGSDEYNIGLSQRRADAVAAELEANGVPTSMVSTAALGESDPAVPTEDGVAEARNRRVVIVLPVAAPPPAAVAAAPAPTSMQEAEMMAEESGLGISIGPLYGHNFKEQDEGETENDLAGVELKFEALPGFLGGVSLKQGVLWSFNGIDDGLTGRSVVSVDLAPDLGFFRPVFSLNAGGVYGEGVQDGFVAGPEIGLDFQISSFTIRPKVAYDYQFRNTDWDEGIIWGGLDLGLRF